MDFWWDFEENVHISRGETLKTMNIEKVLISHRIIQIWKNFRRPFLSFRPCFFHSLHRWSLRRLIDVTYEIWIIIMSYLRGFQGAKYFREQHTSEINILFSPSWKQCFFHDSLRYTFEKPQGGLYGTTGGSGIFVFKAVRSNLNECLGQAVNFISNPPIL